MLTTSVSHSDSGLMLLDIACGDSLDDSDFESEDDDEDSDFDYFDTEEALQLFCTQDDDESETRSGSPSDSVLVQWWRSSRCR